MTLLHATRTCAAKDVAPGATIVDPEGKAGHLLVHSVTRNFGGEVELAVYPPGRREGKRRVVRVQDDSPLLELADEQQRTELLELLADGNADLSLTAGGGALVIGWEGGWRATLSVTDGGSLCVPVSLSWCREPNEVTMVPATEPAVHLMGDEANEYVVASRLV